MQYTGHSFVSSWSPCFFLKRVLVLRQVAHIELLIFLTGSFCPEFPPEFDDAGTCSKTKTCLRKKHNPHELTTLLKLTILLQSKMQGTTPSKAFWSLSADAFEGVLACILDCRTVSLK